MDQGRNRERGDFARGCPRREQFFERAEDDHGDHAQKEDADGKFLTFRCFKGLIVFSDNQFLVLAGLHAADKFRILCKFRALPVDRQAGAERSDNEGRYRDREDLNQRHVQNGKACYQSSHGGAHGACHHSDTCGNHRRGNRSFGAHLRGSRHFGDDRIDREGHVSRAAQNHKERTDKGPHDRDGAWPFAKHFFSYANEKIEAACTLQNTRASDHGNDNQKRGDGRGGWLKAKTQNQNTHA